MPQNPKFLSALEALKRRLQDVPGILAAHPGWAGYLRRTALAACVVVHGLVLMALIGGLVVPALASRYLHEEVSHLLGRDIRIESLRFNPFTFDIQAKGLTVMDKAGSDVFAAFSRMELNLDPMTFIWGRRFTVSRFHLEEPVFHLVRDAQGRFNLDDLFGESPPKESSQPQTFELVPPGVRFTLSDIRLADGSISFADDITGTLHEIKDLHFTIDSLSSDQAGLREIFSTGGLVNESSLTLTVKADLTGEAPEVEARLSVRDLVFRHYTPYLLTLKKPVDLKMSEVGVWTRMMLPKKGSSPPALIEGNMKLSGVSLVDEDREVAGLSMLEVQGASFDFASGGARVERVEIHSPHAKVNRDEAGIIDLIALLEPAGGDAEGSRGQGPQLSLGEAILKDGRAELNDQGLGITMALTDIQVKVKDFDTASGRIGSATLEASGDRFKRMAITTEGIYAPAALSGKASMEGIDLSKPLPALKRLVPKLELAGSASYGVSYELGESEGRWIPKIKADLDIHGLRAMVEGQGKPLLNAGALSIKGVQADVDARRLHVGQVELSDGAVTLTRGEAGRFSALDNLGLGQAESKSGGQAPWSVAVDQIRLAKVAAEYSDIPAKVEQRVELEELGARDFSSSLEKALTISGKGTLGNKAPFEVSGEVRLKEPSLALKLSLTGFPLADMTRLVPQLPMTALSGMANISGETSASLDKDILSVSFKGDMGIVDLKLARPGKEEPWAALSGLSAKGVSFSLAPLDFKASSLTIDDPWLSIALDKEGKPVLPFDSSPAKPTKGKQQPMPSYSLDRVEMKGGKVDLSVQGFEPAFTAQVKDIKATLSEVRANRPAKLTLGFGLGHSGRFKADGLAGWVDSSPVLDLRAVLENMDLGELSQVSQKFTGFPITRGKLGLKLDYKASGKTLDLKNNIVAVGIQLGRKSALPGGKDVPLDLAVSLLSDSKGVIDLDIPVKGDMSQAKADLHDVISTAMAGAFAKILFSPFAFLNVAQGTGQSAYVAFAPGSAELTPEAKKTLTSLGDAIANRPRLNLEIMAYVDPGSEAQALSAALAASRPAGKPQKGQVQQAAPPQPSQEDWAQLARQRQDAILTFLAGQGKISQERTFTVTGDYLAPPKAQGQPGSRADVRLRY
jgi:hypothetical protein